MQNPIIHAEEKYFKKEKNMYQSWFKSFSGERPSIQSVYCILLGETHPLSTMHASSLLSGKECSVQLEADASMCMPRAKIWQVCNTSYIWP